MIYFICRNIGKYGGAAVVAMDVLESLISTGNEIGVVNRNTKIPERLYKDLYKADWITMPFSLENTNYGNGYLGKIKYLMRSVQSKWEMRELKKKFNVDRPELLIFNTLTIPEQKIFHEFKDQCKTAQIVHLSPKFLKDFDNVLKLEDAVDIFESSDALIFVSEECRKEWLSYTELENKKSYYIPNCADEITAEKLLEKQKESIRKNLGMDPNKFYLVSVGSLKPAKGQDILLKVAPALKKIAPDLEILVIGRGHGNYANHLKNECKNNGLDFVNFLGRKTNAMEYIYASDAFILPSRTEAFPLVILESMVLKTPVLASNVNGVREMISDRENGYLFEIDNLKELTAAFNSMYNNKEERENFANKSSEKYWDNFSKKHFVKRYQNVVNKLTQ